MTKPTITTQELQRRIGHRAKSAPEHRFWGLHVHLVKLGTLEGAYLEAKRNRGAPGADGETFEMIEARGRSEFLAELAAELRDGTYKPRPYRRREIPKEGGKVRVISIPTIRDRVVQGALRLLLEPIFEADFSRHSYGARPGRSAHDAIAEVRSGLIWKKHLVVDVDLKSFFDDIGHVPMLAKVARRVQYDRVLGLIKQFLKSTGKKGIPQGSLSLPGCAIIASVSSATATDVFRGRPRGRGDGWVAADSTSALCSRERCAARGRLSALSRTLKVLVAFRIRVRVGEARRACCRASRTIKSTARSIGRYAPLPATRGYPRSVARQSTASLMALTGPGPRPLLSGSPRRPGRLCRRAVGHYGESSRSFCYASP